MPTIKFTLEYCQDSVSFLYVLVKKNPDPLSTSVFRKPPPILSREKYSYYYYTSYHPPGLKKSLPYSQLLRAKRICSSDNTFNEQAHEICDRFNSRGNHDSVVQTCFDKAKDVDRSGLLASKPLYLMILSRLF